MDKKSGKFVGAKTWQHIGLYKDYEGKSGCLSGTPILYQSITPHIKYCMEFNKFLVIKEVKI